MRAIERGRKAIQLKLREMGPDLYTWAQEIHAEGAVTMSELGADQGATKP
jgi:hypothetical protein